MKCCKFVFHHATFWLGYTGGGGRVGGSARRAKIKQPLNIYASRSYGWCHMLPIPSPVGSLSLWVASGKILRAKINNKHRKWCTPGTAVSGMEKILDDFDKLIIEQTGNTRLMCVITTNMGLSLKERGFCVRVLPIG